MNSRPFPLATLLVVLLSLAALAGCGSDDPATPTVASDPAEFSATLNKDLDDVIREMTSRIDALIDEGTETTIPAAEVRQRTRRIAADASADLVERLDLADQEAIGAGVEYTPSEREFLEGRTFLAVYSQQLRVEDALDVPLGLEDPFAD